MSARTTRKGLSLRRWGVVAWLRHYPGNGLPLLDLEFRCVVNLRRNEGLYPPLEEIDRMCDDGYACLAPDCACAPLVSGDKQ